MANRLILNRPHEYVKQKNVILYKFRDIVLRELANDDHSVYNR